MFEQATRNKYRFPSHVGLIDIEDLWDLSLERIDSVYKSLKSELKEVEEESLLNKVSPEDNETRKKLEIVTYIFGVKLAEKEYRLKAKEKAEHKQQLLAILKEKQTDEYKGKSVEELQQLIDQL
jgi:hypothetical protein